jgi:hypothetical protein
MACNHHGWMVSPFLPLFHVLGLIYIAQLARQSDIWYVVFGLALTAVAISVPITLPRSSLSPLSPRYCKQKHRSHRSNRFICEVPPIRLSFVDLNITVDSCNGNTSGIFGCPTKPTKQSRGGCTVPYSVKDFSNINLDSLMVEGWRVKIDRS